jgi:hypothetical protein
MTKHLVATLVAVVMIGLGFFVIWANRTHIGVAEMAFGGGFMVMAAGILLGTDFKQALSPLMVLVKLVRGQKDDASNG